MTSQRILLTGRNGQIGWELERTLASLGEVIATDRSMLDLADPGAIRHAARHFRPAVIVNAAAYTSVDGAEAEPALAMKINGEGPGVFAEEAGRLGALLVHYSTDYVFAGTKTTPYTEDEAPSPLSVYGKTKLAGERAVRASGCRHVILRLSWIYGLRGRNFLLAILRKATGNDDLRIVDDQTGAPTWSRSVAAATAQILGVLLARTSDRGGVYHLSAAGQTTWFEFAREALRIAGLRRSIQPILTSQYPTPATRPAYSVLDNTRLRRDFGVAVPHWRDDLERCLAERGP